MGYITEVLFYTLLFSGSTLALDPSLISPCPTGFTYRYQDNGKNIWYGTIFILSDSDSYTIESIRILLDREAEELKLISNKNPAVIVDTLDNTEFLIEGFNEKVRKTNTFSLTIALKYSPRQPIPKLTAYRVNEFTVCSQAASVGTDGQIHIKQPTTYRPTTTRPSVNLVGATQSPWTSRPSWISPQQTPLPASSSEGTCGSRIQAVTPLIVGGVESRRGEWPWHGALFSLEGQNTQYRCGSSLVTKRHVVTAAHCVCIHQRSEETIDAHQIYLVFGRSMLFDWANPDSQNIRAKNVLVHPEYNSTNLRNDLAVIRLEQSVRITPFVRPICLWADNHDLKLLLKKKGTIVGWGFTAEGKISEILQHAEIPVIEHFECVSKKQDFYLQYLSQKSFCAGSIGDAYTKTKQACNGDSGGGLIFVKPGTDIWQLRGVVSLAPFDRDANMCDVKLYMVFTDVAYYLDWIYQCIRNY